MPDGRCCASRIKRHINIDPEGKRNEIRAIVGAKGFDGATRETIVTTITPDRSLWLDTMLVEEHGVTLTGPLATRAGFATFTTFVPAGVIP